MTGRLAVNDPNLQNIPIRTAEGRRIREAFIAPPGTCIVSADYSQIELRIMAHLSEDAALLRAFAAGEDIHRAPPPRSSACRPSEVTRRAAPLRQGDQLRADLRHVRVRPGAAARHRAQRRAAVHGPLLRALSRASRSTCSARARSAREKGYVETVFGRRLWLPDIKRGGRPAARGRRARRDQRADAGHGGRPDQARDDRGARLARPRAARARSSSCRCTTSWCSKCPRRSSRA